MEERAICGCGKKKNLMPRMERCENWLIENPEAYRGKWKRLETGCKGDLAGKLDAEKVVSP